MNANFVILTFILVVYQSIPNCETRMVCRQKVHNTMEFLKCPPPEDEHKVLKYCCINNGMMSCCNYNDYQARHEGPNARTLCLVIVAEVMVIALSIWWCCRCVHG